jgi:hypothetical protein
MFKLHNRSRRSSSAALCLSCLLFGCAGAQSAAQDDQGPSVGLPGTGGRKPSSSGGAGNASGGSAGNSSTGGSDGSTGSGGAGPAGGSGGGQSGSAGDDGGAPPPADGGPGGETPTGAPATAVETIDVGGAAAVTMKTSLAMGELYLLKASGAVDFGGQKVDAEYGSGAGMPADEAGGVDLGIDVGLLQIHPKVHTTATPPGPGRMKWGPADRAFRDDHVYYMFVTGAAKPLALKLAGPAGGTGTGSITVSLLQLSPAPPKALGTELETVMVPLLKTQVAMKMSTVAGKQYILQASGTGKVSKGGIGDAEYMDFDVEGTKFNEGESGADFGIGVDELDVGVRPAGGASYKPRLRWWGPWRKDHTYYMIFIGTGKPIQLLYFDSGYGDNGPMDALPLKVFAAP